MWLTREEALADLDASTRHRRMQRLPMFPGDLLQRDREGLTPSEQRHWTTQAVELIRATGVALRK